MPVTKRVAARIPAFLGVPRYLQLDLRLAAWTALAALDGEEGHAAAVTDLKMAARAVLALTCDGQRAATAALSALPATCEGRAPLRELKAVCTPMVERFDAMVAHVRWDRLYQALGSGSVKAHSSGAALS